MLAGLQSMTDTLFPAIRDLVPSDDEVKLGEQKKLFGRIVEISAYKTEIFDMHSSKDRAAYNRRMLDLSKRVQTAQVRILVHDRQVLTRKDGSVGWFGYLEWMEYQRKDAEDGEGTAEAGSKDSDHVAV